LSPKLNKMVLATVLSILGIALITLAAAVNFLYISIAGSIALVAGAVQYVQALKSESNPVF
jgi:uncharacterized membrane protein HdeD (DUF308 family)